MHTGIFSVFLLSVKRPFIAPRIYQHRCWNTTMPLLLLKVEVMCDFDVAYSLQATM